VTTTTLRARRGFTLIEIMISMTLMLTVIGLSTQLFRRQSGAVSMQAGRLDAQQNSRFALANLDRELRMVGGGVVEKQPLIVMAGATSLSFNADLVALDTGDYAAVYVNPDADSAAVGGMRTTNKITLPGTSKLYPDTNYTQSGGAPSSAETITYWLSRDSTSSRSNEYILFRRANARPPRVVARGIRYNTGDTVFQYFTKDSLGNLKAISAASLPLIHTAPIHGTSADTGRSALTDSILQVRANFTSVYHDPRTGQDVARRMDMRVKLMNSGLVKYSMCGNPPLGVTPSATLAMVNGVPVVTVSWGKSIDETTGEKDVERYAIYRRLSTSAAFDEPFASVPAGLPSGQTSYSLPDTDLLPGLGQTWIYGVASQDCTPLSSPITEAPAVVIP
jgi:prepilin-type N-terminal cleavage/methylation domain-containing protein